MEFLAAYWLRIYELVDLQLRKEAMGDSQMYRYDWIDMDHQKSCELHLELKFTHGKHKIWNSKKNHIIDIFFAFDTPKITTATWKSLSNMEKLWQRNNGNRCERLTCSTSKSRTRLDKWTSLLDVQEFLEKIGCESIHALKKKAT